MIAIHDALRRDPGTSCCRRHGPAMHRPRARWAACLTARQLRFHLARRSTRAMWPRVRPKLAGDSHGQALLDAMDDERQLARRPAQAMIDDAIHTWMPTPGGSANCWPAADQLAIHQPHEEEGRCRSSADPVPRDSAASPQSIRGGHSTRAPGPRSRGPWPGPSPDIPRARTEPTAKATARLLCRAVYGCRATPAPTATQPPSMKNSRPASQ